MFHFLLIIYIRLICIKRRLLFFSLNFGIDATLASRFRLRSDAALHRQAVRTKDLVIQAY